MFDIRLTMMKAGPEVLTACWCGRHLAESHPYRGAYRAHSILHTAQCTKALHSMVWYYTVS